MRLTVLRFMGQALSEPLFSEFGDAGGTIGRDAACTLQLPDPYKHISRIQAEVTGHRGVFVLTDRGSSNPVLKGGSEIGHNKQVVLSEGDLLTVGDYEVMVSFVSPSVAGESLPAAPVFGLDLTGSEQSDIETIPPTQFWNNLTGVGGAASQDPFAQLVSAAAPAPAVTTPPMRPSVIAPGMIPDDFDPFAPDVLPMDNKVDVLGPDTGRAGAPLSGTADPMGPLAGQHRIAQEDGIDALFGLAGASANPLGSNSALSDPLTGPNTSGAHDPLLAFSQGNKASQAPVADKVPEVYSNFRVPQVQVPEVRVAPTAPAPAPEPEPASPGAFRSWDHPEQPMRTVTLGPVMTPPPAPAPAPTPINNDYASIVDAAVGAHRSDFQPIPKTRPTARIDAMNQAALAAASAAGLPPAQDQIQALTNALLAGLGLSALPRSADLNAGAATLSPDLMRKLGAMLRISMQGTLDLLAARNMLKKELRSEMTMIVSSNNNPMKFSPDATAALAQMLAPRTLRGFMEAVPAMQDTYNDLLAHQVGFVAGMRAAMQGLIDRFDPKVLETRLAKPNVLSSLVPGSRKAKLWELFNELYEDISLEAEDDFEALFGRAFLKAYEEQISRLEQFPAPNNDQRGGS